ncbi:GntR family transcriptional regulator [Aquamicrobium sp. LC103]|uniref:GntR family transcriptional regulator n=1 Tax=Aquamicrobium sp. LC103 TaxID=1120658 RepID=UPI00063ECF0F|nr:GntR family transcriptional regulator [Aquamicrobium sp. LC103]TKT76269.1 GntR family transcriptional regulator [Aquamicrobium sp. LC103]
MKDNSVYKRSHNACLDLIRSHATGALLGSEPSLAQFLEVSRTTVRTILSSLAAAGILHVEGREKRVLRHPYDDEYFPVTETESSAELVERKFMELILKGDLKPGSMINTLELARQFAVSTSAIREYLSGFNRFGLIAKRPNSSWVFQGFTRAFALELSDIRELFELKSIEVFAERVGTEQGRRKLKELKTAHIDLLDRVETDYHNFSALDESFHRAINDASQNRFIREFYDVISLIFHYHFQWNKIDERERNEVAIHEHLAIMEALEVGDIRQARKAAAHHLESARKTLLRSIRDA